MEAVLERAVYLVSTFWEYFRIVLDVLLVAFLLYWVYTFISNTRAMQLLKGLVAIFVVAVLSHVLRLDTLNWLITMTSYIVITVIILFHPELRRLLTQFRPAQLDFQRVHNRHLSAGTRW
jgi:diadenylate cyclase